MLEKEAHRDYWMQSAEADMETMQILFTNSQYLWALFIGHLVIEKTLKALYVQNRDENVPRMHDLTRLAKLAGIEINEETEDNLDVITTFNINARYIDVKNRFHQTCTLDYTNHYKKIIEDLYQWLLTLLIQN
jgi:HEPN domain-containing protein